MENRHYVFQFVQPHLVPSSGTQLSHNLFSFLTNAALEISTSMMDLWRVQGTMYQSKVLMFSNNIQPPRIPSLIIIISIATPNVHIYRNTYEILKVISCKYKDWNLIGISFLWNSIDNLQSRLKTVEDTELTAPHSVSASKNTKYNYNSPIVSYTLINSKAMKDNLFLGKGSYHSSS